MAKQQIGTNKLREFYRPTMALLTDLYQLTMAYGYWKSGISEREAVFNLFFRRNPFGGGFSIAAGLATVVDFLKEFRFGQEDLEYLAGLTGNDGEHLFSPEFLNTLEHMQLSCHVDAIPEGTVVQPHEPLVRVRGPLLQCQLLETPLLNLVNFPTLIATKAARVVQAAQGDSVLEFGLRRAQGIDGGLTASRAAYLGGCEATSNVLAGQLFDIPVKGTHAHSWVTAFESEAEAFEAYADAMPNNCVFLVDTYDTLEGVRKAALTAASLRRRGHEIVGIRLDSGDLAELSKESRKILDASGLPNALIVASSDLDEYRIADLKARGSQIDIWGVGTRLITAFEQPAINGVYKMSAIRDRNHRWRFKLKLSEQGLKTNDPGILQVRRYHDEHFVADVIYEERLGIPDSCLSLDRSGRREAHRLDAGLECFDLLVPVLRSGKAVYVPPSLEESRRLAREQIQRLPEEVRRAVSPAEYPVGLECSLSRLKDTLISEARDEMRTLRESPQE